MTMRLLNQIEYSPTHSLFLRIPSTPPHNLRKRQIIFIVKLGILV